MKKILSILLVTLLILLTPVMALADSGGQDGFRMNLTTDKSSYGADETVSVKAALTNANKFAVSNVKVELMTPNGMALKSGETPKTVDLKAQQSVTFPFTLVRSTVLNPFTGSASNPFLLIALALICTALLAVLLVWRKRNTGSRKPGSHKPFTRALSLLLCGSLLLTGIAGQGGLKAKAASASTQSSFSVSQKITVGGISKTVTVKVTYPTFTDKVTVSFNTNGGSTVSPVTVPKGGTLSEVPMPTKTDSSFVGWFTDKGLTQQFYSDQQISSDTTLYAAYTATNNNLKSYVDPETYIDDCKSDVSYSVISPVELTAANLADYVQITSYLGDIPEMKVTADNGVYTITPVTPYPAGGTFLFTLLNDKLTFSGQDAQIRKILFRIYKAPVEDVEAQDNLKYVLWSDVQKKNDNTYAIPSDKYTITEGNTVCFWDGKLDSSSRMCDIESAAPFQNGGVNYTVLSVKDAKVTDVLKKVDVSMEKDIPASEYTKNANTKKIAEAAKKSAGTLQLTKILAASVISSPSAQKLYGSASTDSNLHDWLPVDENDDGFTTTVDALVDGLTVTASICSATDENFYNREPNDWVGLTLKFDYNAVIKGKVEVKASFVVKEYVKSSLQGDIEWGGGDVPFCLAQNVYSHTIVTLSVLIRSIDTSESDYLDITQEIENLTSQGEDTDDDAPSILKSVLGSKGDYLELLNVNLVTVDMTFVDILPILDISAELNFVVRVNFAAGVSASTSVTVARQTGICGSISDGISSYSAALPGNGYYSFDMYAAGYLGFKAGLELALGFSITGLKDIGEVGIEGEVGAYLDLYGFFHLNINKVFRDYPVTSLQGGLYMEVGIYAQVDLFAKSSVFHVKAEYTLAEVKIPLLTVGNRYVLWKFTSNNTNILLKSGSMKAADAGLFNAVYLDLTTGDTVTGSFADPSLFTVQLSTPYFNFDGTNITIQKQNFGKAYAYFDYVSPQTKRLDATATVYYLGDNLYFSHTLDGYAYRTVTVTWIDPSVSTSGDSSAKVCKANYVLDYGGQSTVLLTKDVPYAAIPGGIDLSKYTYSGPMTFDNDYSQPILKDTTYTIHIKPYQLLESYISYYDNSWHLDVYAVSVGQTPSVPPKYDSSGSGQKFTGWSGAPGFKNYGSHVTQIQSVSYDYVGLHGCGSDYYLSGLNLDTTKPVYSSSGSYNDCYTNYCTQKLYGHSLTNLSQYIYTANYQSASYFIEFQYPAMDCQALGNTYTISASNFAEFVKYGEQPYNPTVKSYPGCTFEGWDSNDDGKADYTQDNLPLATSDMTLTAIYKPITHAVTVEGQDGSVTQTLAVNEGTIPTVLSTSPAWVGSGDYRFQYWEVSVNGGDFVKWTGQEPGVYSNWTVRPVYAAYYTVTFDYAGGTADGQKSKTVAVRQGTYRIGDLIDAQPSKASTVYNTYSFAGWDCGDMVTVNGNVTITAQYTATPISYTAAFHTDVGQFAAGGADSSYTGGYTEYQSFISSFLAQNTAETIQPVYTADTIYTFQSWQATNENNSVSYTAVWSSTPRTYTVTFQSGEGTFTGGATQITNSRAYHYAGDFSAVNNASKAADVYNTYKLTGWKDQTGKAYALTDTFTVTGDMTFTAVYGVDHPIVYTITFLSGNGRFPDGSAYENFYGTYGQTVNISVDSPVWDSGSPSTYYEFTGWSNSIPATFTGNITLTAQYQTKYYDYTITFNAGDGTFADGKKTETQTLGYGATIVMKDQPTKAEDDYYTYTFKEWSPALTTVTGNTTYTAVYTAASKGTKLQDAGITVSNGTELLDISCNGIPGCTYSMVHLDAQNVNIPVLTITGDGLTFSGSSSTVYVEIEDGVHSVTFDNLTLSGDFPYRKAIITLPSVTEISATTIKIAENCTFNNTSPNNGSGSSGAIYSNRPLTISGFGGSPVLTLGCADAQALYCTHSFEADNLSINANVTYVNEADRLNAFGFDGDCPGDPTWNFKNVTANIMSYGNGIDVNAPITIDSSSFTFDCMCILNTNSDLDIKNSTLSGICCYGFQTNYGNITIAGGSTINLTSYGTDSPIVDIYGDEYGGGYLNFADFTGTFQVQYADDATGTPTLPAVRAYKGINLLINGVEDDIAYDLNGSQIGSITKDGIQYYCFGHMSGYTFVFDTNVTVKPKSTGV